VTCLYEPVSGGVYAPTELTRGPWDPRAQHGGAPAALLGGALEADGMRLARLTLELVRPVPLTELRVETEVVRPGRRVQLVEGRVHAGDELVVRGLALRLARAEGPSAGEPVAPPPPRGEERSRLGTGRTFAVEANDIRFVRGAYAEPGPATAWVRLTVPVVADRPTTPVQRALAAADFGNGFSAVLEWDAWSFINPDLTVYFERDPVGEWIALDALTRLAGDGTGLAESVLFDERGRFGRAVQALLIQPRAT
jgi:hypothetical protein